MDTNHQIAIGVIVATYAIYAFYQQQTESAGEPMRPLNTNLLLLVQAGAWAVLVRGGGRLDTRLLFACMCAWGVFAMKVNEM